MYYIIKSENKAAGQRNGQCIHMTVPLILERSLEVSGHQEFYFSVHKLVVEEKATLGHQ